MGDDLPRSRFKYNLLQTNNLSLPFTTSTPLQTSYFDAFAPLLLARIPYKPHYGQIQQTLRYRGWRIASPAYCISPRERGRGHLAHRRVCFRAAFGATVTSWKLANGQQQLFLSEKAHLDGSKPIRGGIPVVFPVFGAPPQNHATSSLPQHGFARNSTWEFLGKSSSESLGKDRKEGDDSVKLDFGLTNAMLTEDFRKAWPFEFGLVYSVTLSKEGLGTTLQVQNKGSQDFEFQVLLHSYLSIEDISKIRINNLESKTYIDKTQNASTQTETHSALPITGETDRIYQSLDPKVPVVVSSADDNKPLFSVTRETLGDVVVWNPWIEKAKGMADFGPDEAYQKMICVEAGSVSGWQTLEAGDSWEGGQLIRPGA